MTIDAVPPVEPEPFAVVAQAAVRAMLEMQPRAEGLATPLAMLEHV